MARVALDLENKDDLQVIKAEGGVSRRAWCQESRTGASSLRGGGVRLGWRTMMIPAGR